MMTVRQLLNSKGHSVLVTHPETTVYDAIKAMAEAEIGALVVTEGDRLVGVISERDYARKIILKGRRSQDTTVREAMTAPAITVTPSQTVQDCMELMTEHRIRHLPVVENDQLIGIISIGDVVKAIMSQQAFMIEQLEEYIARR